VGGIGGNGGDGTLISTVVTVPTPVTVRGATTLAAGAGGTGGIGGTSGHDQAAVRGGAGNVGGEGGDAGDVSLAFNTPTVSFLGNIDLAAGRGGDGGRGGNSYSLLSTAGTGGEGGVGGEMTFTVLTDMAFEGYTLTVASGSGGDTGGAGTQLLLGALPGTGGAGGVGGDATFAVGRDLSVTAGITEFRLTKGGVGSNGGGAAGTLSFEVVRNLEIAAGRELRLLIAGPMDGQDNVLLTTLFLRPGASLSTTATVYTANASKPASGQFYQVRNLDLVTRGTWATAGTYAPTTGATEHDYVRFDMSDVAPSALMLGFTGAGAFSLQGLDPMAQHEKYLANPDRPYWSDDPAYRTYNGSFVSDAAVAPAFLTSAYQTKRLHLGNVILISRTDGSPLAGTTVADSQGNLHYVSDNSAHGDLYDGFAYTAGLRRYYFDVYVDQGADRALMASNVHTADASKVYAQAAISGMVTARQAFETALAGIEGALDGAIRSGRREGFRVGAALSGGRLKVDTGSHAKVSTFSGAITLSKVLGHDSGDSIIGLFAEYGNGSYDTFAHVPRYGDVFGSGDTSTLGGGIFARTLWNRGTFLAASFRGGMVRNDFSLTRDPWAQNPGVHSGDNDSSYVGAHVELGQRFSVTDGTNIEGYGKFLWTHAAKDEFMTRFGDRISIGSFDSARGRIGARVRSDFREGALSFYFGLAAEREFKGELTGNLNEDAFQQGVDSGGTSGFGELGLDIKAGERLSISIGAYGWAGNVKGGGGTASLNLSF
jgi:hypothetical protein